MKEMFGYFRIRIWTIVSAVCAALLIAVWILSSGVFYDSICMALGDKRVVGRGGKSYYSVKAKTKREAYENGNALTESVCEEGIVLLKNKDNSLPLEKNSRVSVFGKNSVNFVYGGSGSGGGNFRGAITLYESLKNASFIVNPVLQEFYSDKKLSGEGRPANPAIEDNSNKVLPTGETPQKSYTDKVKESYSRYADAAILVFSRIGGEGNDLPRAQPGDKSKHYLQLDKNEEDLLKAVTEFGFKKVIAIFNAGTSMQAGEIVKNDKIDACLSVGGTGFAGLNALGSILNGSVTPSGKTVDTWVTDFTKDPVYVNFGDNGTPSEKKGAPDGATYTVNGASSGYYFVNYEEGIYLGYRYYETRGADEGEDWYHKQVSYPFGYGLSYTTFEWKIRNESALGNIELTSENKNKSIEIEVEVTNTGKYKGKDVVELYCELPSGKIEKPSVVLVGFAKTPMLYPAAGNAANAFDAANGSDKPNSAVVKLSFEPYYAASYDYLDSDSDSFFGYQLEAGKYLLKLKTDVHTDKAGVSTLTCNVSKTIRYEKDNKTGKLVENRFSDADDMLETVLSRKDWKGTMPKAKNTFALTDELKEKLTSTATNNPQKQFKKSTLSAEKKKNAIEMRGVDYSDDEKWEEFLDTLSFAEIKDLFNRGAYKTAGIMRLNLPETLSADGPVGFVNFISDVNVAGNVAYPSEYVLGCTWNVDLAREMGESVGEEAAYGKGGLYPTPYTGWYAPGLNLHRSPFGGRNFEYFSEDPLLSGFMAAAEIRGAQSNGVVPYMKHFALNEQETHRDDNGVATWATEQAIRELYLRPFEIAVKEADAKGIMSSFNRIGATWTGGDFRLLTEVLREEWGFEGSVICDFNVSSYMSAKQMIYGGGDLNLTLTRYWLRPDENNDGDVAMLRRAAKNVLFSVVNSNAMNGIDEKTVLRFAMPVWQEVTLVTECAVIVGLMIWGFFEIRAFKKKSRGEKDKSI